MYRPTIPTHRLLQEKTMEHLPFIVHHHVSCQNFPIDGVGALADEYNNNNNGVVFH